MEWPMLRSLTTCFSSHRSAQNSVENAEMVTGHISSEGLGQTLTYAGNTVVSSACQTQMLSAGHLALGVTVGQPSRVLAAKPTNGLSVATEIPIPTQPEEAASRPAGRYKGKTGVSSNTLPYQTSCLRPGSLFILLESFHPRNEQDAHAHFLNMVSIVSTWSPRWQGKGWPVVAQYCLKSLSPDNLTAACRVLIDA